MSPGQPVRAGKLAGVLRTLLDLAHQQQPAPARQTLKGGLQISVRITRVGTGSTARSQVGLQLSRAGDKPPSLQEWHTVLAHWPAPLGELAPTEISLAGRRYLQAHFAYQPPLPLSADPANTPPAPDP